jgi:hypothetical protein
MKLHHLISATLTLLVAAAGCSKDFNGTIACASDSNCPSGYHCAADGKCQTGEASVKVDWVSPPAGTFMRGAQAFRVTVSHPDGVATIRLLRGTTVLATVPAPSQGFGANGPGQVDFTGVDTSALPDGVLTLTAEGASSKGQTGNSLPRPFVVDNHESVPTLVTTSPPSPSNSGAPTFLLKGTADVGLTVAPSTVYIFTESTCNGGVVAGAVASGTPATFLEPGIAVPVVPNAATAYFAMAVDSLGNASACSAGSLTFTNAQFCGDVITSAQIFSPVLQGCGGRVTFANRATLCAPGCRAATADEWSANFGGTPPTHHYWTDDPLNFSSGAGACGATSCNTDGCFATRGNALANTCFAGQPMRVCSGTGAADQADADGNTCTWSACGYNSVTPKQFFGGCSGTNDNTAGTLCVCNITQWFVSAAAGNDGNAGTSAAKPFKTITKALSLASRGQTVFVKPGTYNVANGEVFPLKVPTGVLLIGDEPSRGNASGSPTNISGTAAGCGTFSCSVNPGAGSTVAGFLITGVTNDGISATAAGATIRNNTFTGNGGFSMRVSSPNQTILLNAFTTNTGWGILYSAGSTATGKVENNTFTGNNFGIEMDAAGGDLGPGPQGSVGNNVFSCNTNTDLWTVPSLTLFAGRNKWDHVPPTTSATGFGSGLDLYTNNVAANTASANTGAGIAPGTICP